MNVELSSLELYPCELNNVKDDDKVDSLLEILAELVEKPKYTNNLSLKAYEILEEKVVVLTKKLD